MASPVKKGRVAIIGAGPAGMAAAISISQAGHDVAIFERYKEVRPAGNLLNLWPPPIKALGLMGVDIEDFGAPCLSQFKRADGRLRATVNLPQDVIDKFGGGFIGLLRPDLFRRLQEALPADSLHPNKAITSLTQDDAGVQLTFANGEKYDADILVGADGIDSTVRRILWGEQPKRDHNLLVLGGTTFTDVPGSEYGRCVISHDRTIQASWTSFRDSGRSGSQWWVVSSFDGSATFTGDILARAKELAKNFAFPIPELMAATKPEDTQTWQIRDRVPLKQWSKGRITIVGDAAHPTSPYAAHGAGMAMEDGYFLGRRLAGLDLSDFNSVRSALQTFEEPRKPHTEFQVQMAYRLGKIFHYAPAPLRPLRDLIFDHTGFLQKMVGEGTPKEILSQLNEIENVETTFRKTVPT